MPSKHHVPPFMALPPRIRDRRMPGPVAQPVPSIGRRLGAAAEVSPDDMHTPARGDTGLSETGEALERGQGRV